MQSFLTISMLLQPDPEALQAEAMAELEAYNQEEEGQERVVEWGSDEEEEDANANPCIKLERKVGCVLRSSASLMVVAISIVVGWTSELLSLFWPDCTPPATFVHFFLF